MINKNQIKAIRQLEHKKFRRETGLFVAEGPKVVGDLLEKMAAVSLFATEEWLERHPQPCGAELTVVCEEELRRASFLQHPQQVLGTFRIPDTPMDVAAMSCQVARQLSLALDGVRDPGNLGTIIRVADWFGIETVYCSPDTADAYSPKVVQATMGSIARVRMVYSDLCELIDAMPDDVPVYGTVLDGENIYAAQLENRGLLVMGNEGKGISSAVTAKLTHRLLIPHSPLERATADSLNVAIATAIACSEFRRR